MFFFEKLGFISKSDFSVDYNLCVFSLAFSYLSPTNGLASMGEWGQEVAYSLCFYSLCGNFLVRGHTESFHSPPWHLTVYVT